MKRLHITFIKWVSSKLGYKIVMLKGMNGVTVIEGDKELLRYVDISGYFFNKELLSRIKPHKVPTTAKEMFLGEPKPDVTNVTPIQKLTREQLSELGVLTN